MSHSGIGSSRGCTGSEGGVVVVKGSRRNVMMARRGD